MVFKPDHDQFLNPVHTVGMKSFILELRDEGITDKDIHLMCRKTPAKLLGIDSTK